MQRMREGWKILREETETPVVSLAELTPVSIHSGQEGLLGYKAMMEIGRQIDRLEHQELDGLECRWGEWIILFPGTQCKDKDGNIFVPSLRHSTRMVSLGIISRSWVWEWFSCTLFEREEFVARLGMGMSRIRDANNLYSKGVGILVLTQNPV